MVKHPVSFYIPLGTIQALGIITDSLSKSKNWVVEQAIYNYGHSVDKFLSVEDDFREYLKVKAELWKDDLWGEQLRYHMRQGFILKNSIKKIVEMVQSGVNKPHILKIIGLYEKLARDSEYKELLIDIRDALTGRKDVDIDKIKLRLEIRHKERVLQ